MSQQTETIASLVRVARYQLQVAQAAKVLRKQYDQVALSSGTVAERAAFVDAAGLDFGDTDDEKATALTNLATFAENVAKLVNGGVLGTSIDTSLDWLATMVEMEPSGMGVDKLHI